MYLRDSQFEKEDDKEFEEIPYIESVLNNKKTIDNFVPFLNDKTNFELPKNVDEKIKKKVE